MRNRQHEIARESHLPIITLPWRTLSDRESAVRNSASAAEGPLPPPPPP